VPKVAHAIATERRPMKTLIARGIATIVLAGGVIAGAWAARSEPNAPIFATFPPPADAIGTPPVGCASSSCHGGQRVGPTGKGSEQTTWSTSDPHATAYRVLFNDDSQRIAKNLNIGKAHEAKQCLACHAVDTPKTFHGEAIADRAVGDGVGCDGCHGPSQKWLGLHYTATWRGLSERAKFEQYGFTPLKDPVARVMSCAGCHVGEAGREVNHDLIAAGHPRLAFEATRYHYTPRYTLHWVEPTANPEFEVRLWAIGQVATLRAAVALLAVRAERAAAKPDAHPWPELSESSCYSCHRGIGDSPRAKPSTARSAGTLPWQTWYAGNAGVLPIMSRAVLPNSVELNLATLRELSQTMESRTADPKTVQRLSNSVLVGLDAWLVEAQRTPIGSIPTDTAEKLTQALAVSALTADRSALADADWDTLAQHYLGLAALYHARGGQAAAPMLAAQKPHLEFLQQNIRFPSGKVGDRLDSPAGFQPDRLADSFRALVRPLSSSGAAK
ncbi:MAG: multiheme c-type cytochrome, partial [Gemmataceae bacterium]